ncbi:hypothetical protein ACL02S_16630 [Nocardia sp. 004]|uniref:hypothetical protein n=1 Tax=Nocardia sp. 004 TaxID=3385978 RepID=UPI0039A16BF4
MTSPSPRQPSSYLDQSSGENLRAQLETMRNDIYATMVAPERTEAWDADQLALQLRINDLAEQVNTGVDPRRVTGPDDFEQLTLEQIRDLTYQIKPDMVHAVVEAWDKIGAGLADATRALSDGLRTTIAEHWEGQAAGQAAQSLGRFLGTSGTIAQSAELVGMKVAFAQRGSDETFRMLSPVLAVVAPLPSGAPASSTSTPSIPVLGAQQDAESQREEARQACLQILRNVYSPGIRGGDEGVPVLPPVQPAADPATPVPGPTISGPASSGTAGGSAASGPTATTPSTTTPAPAVPGDQQPAAEGGRTATTPGQDASTQSTEAAATTPAGFGSTQELGNPAASSTPPGHDPNARSTGTPSFPGSGSSGNPGLGGPGRSGFRGSGFGGSGFGGSGRSGFGGSGSGSAPQGRPGISLPGSPSQGLPPAAASSGAARAGMPGAPGMMPGAMAPGGRGKSDDDAEHESSDLLRGRHLEEWIDDGQRVLPAYGVIGEPSPRAAQDPQQPNSSGHGGARGEHR